MLSAGEEPESCELANTALSFLGVLEMYKPNSSKQGDEEACFLTGVVHGS